MRIFLANLLPPEVGDRIRTRGSARRTGLLVALLLISLVGVSLHSWDAARRARAVQSAALSLRNGATDLDAELVRLEADRKRLNDFMTTYRRVALPIEVSDLLATIVNLMPPMTALTDCSVKFVTRDTAAVRAPAAPAAPGAPPPPPPPPPKRVLEVRLRGFAATINEVAAFERALAGMPPLTGVTITENRSLDTPDGAFQEFVITAEVPLDRNYTGVRTGAALALDRRTGSTEASP